MRDLNESELRQLLCDENVDELKGMFMKNNPWNSCYNSDGSKGSKGSDGSKGWKVPKHSKGSKGSKCHSVKKLNMW